MTFVAYCVEIGENNRFICPYLKDDKCTVYGERPRLCRNYPIKHKDFGYSTISEPAWYCGYNKVYWLCRKTYLKELRRKVRCKTFTK